MIENEKLEKTQILEALHILEGKLTATINTGQAQLAASITALTDAHHHALLEQERRNATFAPFSRVDELIAQVHGHSNKLSVHEVKLKAIKDSIDDVCTKVTSIHSELTNRSFSLVSGANGYLISFVGLLIIALFTFLLSHR